VQRASLASIKSGAAGMEEHCSRGRDAMNAQAALGKCTAVLIGAGLALWLMAAPCFGQVGARTGNGGATAGASGGLGVTLGMAGGHVVVTGVDQQGALAGLGLRPGDIIAG